MAFNHEQQDGNKDKLFYNNNLDNKDKDFIYRFLLGLQEFNYATPALNKEYNANRLVVNEKSSVISLQPFFPSKATQIDKLLKLRENNTIFNSLYYHAIV